MKYFILAGEASGDKQAALLCKALAQLDPAAQMTGWGGEAMTAEGVQITRHYRQLAFMGFVEVIRHLPEILRNFSACKKEILSLRPDALILVDYPGFNLRIAAWAHRHSIPVYYYISPQLWAWHTSRVYKIQKSVRKMYVILPFEEAFYRQYGMEVMYIGHPLAKEIHKDSAYEYKPKSLRIALLPGSRRHEVERILPEMVALAELMPEYSFSIAAVPHLQDELYERWISGRSNIHLDRSEMKEVLRQSSAAIVTSGTATLETALLGVPQIVVYKGSPLSYQIARRLIKVKYISLVNLILDRSVVPELIQKDCNAGMMISGLHNILHQDTSRRIQEDYSQLREMLVAGGGAEAAAGDIISDIRQHNDS